MKPRRWSAVVAAVVLVACGGSSKSGGGTAASASADPHSTSTTIVVGPDGSSTVVVPSGGGGDPAGDSHSSDGGGSPGASPINSTGPVGSYGVVILSPNRSTDVVVEVHSQSGAEPEQSSLDHLRSVLSSVSGKTVALVGGVHIDGGAKAWTADEVRALGGAGTAADSPHAVIHLFFVHGTFEGDDSVLGAAVRGDTAAIFVDQVQASSTPLIGSSGIETAVVTHEVGHLLGLVGLVVNAGRQDPDHPGHSTNQRSVMYWAVESSLIGDVLTGGPPKDFDSRDLSDLEAIRASG